MNLEKFLSKEYPYYIEKSKKVLVEHTLQSDFRFKDLNELSVFETVLGWNNLSEAKTIARNYNGTVKIFVKKV
jgi:hypothetical protein